MHRPCVIHRQVEYALKVGEVTAAPDRLRRELARWMADRTPSLQACVPAQALMQVPERLTVTVHLFIQGQKPRVATVLSADPPALPGQPAVDGKCVERVLLGAPALRFPIAAARTSVRLLYAPFCVIWQEHDNPRPSSLVGYGRGEARFLMPVAPPAPPPRPGN